MGIGPKEISRIIRAYDVYHGNASETARHLPYSDTTVKKHWRKRGFRIHLSGDRGNGKWSNELSDEEIEEIVKAYSIYRGNAYEAARHLLCCHDTILKYWRQAGLEIGKPGARRDLGSLVNQR